MDELRSILRQHRFAFLYENVEMDAAAAKVSSDALGVSPVFVCPSDFGWVSRPRLWWLSVDWTRVVTDFVDGSPLEWAKRGRWDRLCLSAARLAADSFELGDLQFHSSVAQGRKLMPCATTPAPTDDGRQKPRSTRGRTPRCRRPLGGGGRQFAPWHYTNYTVEAMLQDFWGGAPPSPAGCEGAAPPHPRRVHGQGGSRHKNSPPHGRERLALGRPPDCWGFSSWRLGRSRWHPVGHLVRAPYPGCRRYGRTEAGTSRRRLGPRQVS